MDDTSTAMDCLKKVKEEIDRGWTGPNPECEYGPCHYAGQDCTYCFCPFHPCGDTELGEEITTSKGKYWSCLYCHLMHRTPVCRYIASRIEELRIEDPADSRLRGLLDEAKERFMVPGKAIMVVGATSDAGKSITAAAICRIISRKGFSVAPMKTQNMSLNSMITSDGSEVASIQIMQAKAARMRHPDHNINPILLKPMKGRNTQAIVNGKHFKDFDVNSYYEKFVPTAGTDAVRNAVRTQKMRYEYVVMEGAGSPAEINIYDKDIANMRAAEIADADCILVVNMQWGGGFAYALGTVELLSPEDRKRMKGIILNNMHGDPSSLNAGIRELESILGIPVLGVIPNIKMPMPKEDSMTMQNTAAPGVRIIVIKLPRMANFTDIDPLYHENVSVRYTADPNDLKDADIIIIPGTKDTMDALRWMRSCGMDKAITERKGTVPIVGLCGGYQLMCAALRDPDGIESDGVPEAEGLKLFDAVTEWKAGGGKRKKVKGALAANGGDIQGYELHAGTTVTHEEPLFILREGDVTVNEGSARIADKLFGTYVHGLFDEPAFRVHLLKMTGKFLPSKYSDVPYDRILDGTLDELADVFERSLNMKEFDRTLGVSK
ncbi:MAG: cobyric acid synthase [Methanomassiliicoccaceae archaeon]|jgi:adenosylcobyric acid synthase|nr:cobyric acid synthase [Methanomassiliicoccaceae archaeon]